MQLEGKLLEVFSYMFNQLLNGVVIFRCGFRLSTTPLSYILTSYYRDVDLEVIEKCNTCSQMTLFDHLRATHPYLQVDDWNRI